MCLAPCSANRPRRRLVLVLVLVLILSTSLAIGAIPASTEVEDENDDDDDPGGTNTALNTYKRPALLRFPEAEWDVLSTAPGCGHLCSIPLRWDGIQVA